MGTKERNKETQERHTEILARLKNVTATCREDMHEPDEQDLKATVVGNLLDNAMGDSILIELLEKGFHEYVVVLERYEKGKFILERFNLADLIALARKAVI